MVVELPVKVCVWLGIWLAVSVTVDAPPVFSTVLKLLSLVLIPTGLSEIIGKDHVTFRDACKYLGEPEIYDDFQTASAFVHGQDIVSKCIPFTFYTSIYHKLYIMMHYIFRTVRLYLSAEAFEDELEMLEKELMELSRNYL